MIDEVREAKELFDKLNDTLTASWDTMYGYAKQYYEQNGDLEMSHQYKAPNGYCLGAWVNKPKKKFREGKLEEPYISLLNELEITWDKSSKAYSWDEMFEIARQYYMKHGDLLVQSDYRDDSGVDLYDWLRRLRHVYERPDRGYLTDEKIEELKSIGMEWHSLYDKR